MRYPGCWRYEVKVGALCVAIGHKKNKLCGRFVLTRCVEVIEEKERGKGPRAVQPKRAGERV
eukprot:3246153-Lingulodinium_polyedra.AAC.1